MIDALGNFDHTGPHYQPGRSLADTVPLIERRIKEVHADIQVTLRRERFTGGQTLHVDVLHPGSIDVSDRAQRERLEQSLHDIVQEFNFSKGNFHQDYHSTGFYAHIHVTPSAFSALAKEQGKVQNPVEAKMSLTEFKRTVKPGDTMEALHGTRLGLRTVEKVRSGDLIFQGKLYLPFGKAKDFACDGELVRFAFGNEYEPDHHLLYRWTRV